MFIHRKPHTSVSAFPSGQIATKQNKTQNEQQHTQKKKVLAKGEATVTKKKKKSGYQMSRPGVRVTLHLSLKKIGGCQAE